MYIVAVDVIWNLLISTVNCGSYVEPSHFYSGTVDVTFDLHICTFKLWM